MDPHQHVLLAGHVALHQGQVLLAVEQALVAVGREVARAGGQVHGGHLPHQLLGAPAVADEVGHRDHLEAVALAVRHQVGHPGHGAVVVHDLADDPGRDAVRPGGPDRRPPRSARPGRARRPGRATRGNTWPGCTRSSGRLCRVDGHLDGARPVGRGDARGHALAGLDGDGEGRAEAGLVGPRHGVQAAASPRALGVMRQADQAPAVQGHEVDRLGRDELGRHGQVALVLPVFVVDDHHHAAALDLLQGLLDGGEVRSLSHDVLPGWLGRPSQHLVFAPHANPCSRSSSSVKTAAATRSAEPAPTPGMLAPARASVAQRLQCPQDVAGQHVGLQVHPHARLHRSAAWSPAECAG